MHQINDEDSSYFKAGKGPRQGDPLSPLLFNLVADVFPKMLMTAAEHNLIFGLRNNNNEEQVISLQYVDDTLLFLTKDLRKAQHVLSSFQV